jgi:hypothetical protein
MALNHESPEHRPSMIDINALVQANRSLHESPSERREIVQLATPTCLQAFPFGKLSENQTQNSTRVSRHHRKDLSTGGITLSSHRLYEERLCPPTRRAPTTSSWNANNPASARNRRASPRCPQAKLNFEYPAFFISHSLRFRFFMMLVVRLVVRLTFANFC